MGKDAIKKSNYSFLRRISWRTNAKNLEIKKTEPIYNIVRLRLYNDKPLTLEHTYMPVKLVPDLDENILHKSNL